MTSAPESRRMWREYSQAAALNPAQRHRWRLVANEVRAGAAGAVPVVVDLGCGSGLLLARIAQAVPGARRVGIDIEPRAIELARRNHPGAEYLVADLQAEAWLPEHLEAGASVVVCSEVIEHLDRPARVITLARRLLRPGGRLIVTVPAGALTPFDRAIGHRNHYTPGSLAALVEEAGLSVERVYRWGFPFHSLFRLAMMAAPGAASYYRDDRLAWPARLAFHVVYWLFFCNLRSGSLGRQLIAVATAPG